MKIEKKLLTVITFIGALLVLLLVFYLMTGFQSGFKDIIGAVYFAVWIAALVGIWLFVIQPYIKDRKKKKSEKVPVAAVHKPGPVPSPHAHLPMRERIREYVSERRKEEGLPVPEPLLPSTGGMGARQPVPSISSSGGAVAGAAMAAAGAGAAVMAADEHDLPLPDDFDESIGTEVLSDEFTDDYPEPNGVEPSLPGIDDDDLGSFDDTGEDEIPMPESGDLPDFEGDLEPDMSESDLVEGPLDFSGEDAESEGPVFEPEPEPEPDQGFVEEGGLSEEGLSDLDLPLDEDMITDDLSGDDELEEIEFEDLEPDEI